MSVQRQIERLTVHRAAEWLEVLRMERSEEYAGFIRWINESPRHMDEFLKLLAVSREARLVLSDSAFDKTALLARISPRVTEFRAAAGQAAKRGTASRHWAQWTGVLAATLAAIAIAALWMTGNLSPWQRFETRIGQHATFDLADGSVVILNARSKIQVKLGAEAREIRLLDGEALFRVAQEANRPFRVYTRDATVQAVGTQFDVATRADGTQVAVIEGKVRISTQERAAMYSESVSATASTHGRATSTPLTAGEAVHVSLEGAIERKSADVAANATAWRHRRLIFEGTPLEEAVNEFNRYNKSLRLRVERVVAGSHHYSGTFDADDLTSFTDLLARERDLIVEQRGNELVIRPRP